MCTCVHVCVYLLVMLFYLIHQLNQTVIPWSKTTREGQKNVFTFLSGAVLYFLLYGMLMNKGLKGSVSGSVVLSVLRDFFPYFVVVDAIAMACLYKNYFHRSILSEIDEIAVAGPVTPPEKRENKKMKTSKVNKSSSGLKQEEVVFELQQHVAAAPTLPVPEQIVQDVKQEVIQGLVNDANLDPVHSTNISPNSDTNNPSPAT